MHLAVLAERAFLNRLEGGCQVPIAAHADCRDGRIHLDGLVADVDGHAFVRDTGSGPEDRGESLGVSLAERLLSKGADRILEKLRAND